MAVLAGIDEAGYGPILGPLVVSGVAFHVPDDQLETCMWGTLRDTCTASPGRSRRRLLITDSKKIYRSRGSLGALERAALVMLAVADRKPTTWRGLLDIVAQGAGKQLEQYPWYTEADIPLPLCDDVGDIPTRANAVRLNCGQHGVKLTGVYSELLSAGHFNRLAKNTRNKAVVLLGMVMRVVDRILRSSGTDRVRLCVDRLGGRQHYRETLTVALPGFDLQILEESPTRSAYRLVGASRVCDVEFVTKGDARHFPVALASVYSKYLRELQMYVFNRYWSSQQQGLRPTAGYYTDAHRWLRDASPTLERLQIPTSLLVRER